LTSKIEKPTVALKVGCHNVIVVVGSWFMNKRRLGLSLSIQSLHLACKVVVREASLPQPSEPYTQKNIAYPEP